jgi:exopolysaccharide production protein ExoQ
MSSSLALLLTLAFIAVLFWRDFRGKPNVTGALWLPFAWIIFSPSSRFLSQWLAIFGFNVGGVTVKDGSPIDAALYSLLIISGLMVLHRRRVSVIEFIRNNRWLTLFLVYCLVATTWSDYPFVSFKRWIKLLGDPVMALVVLTEPELLAALPTLIKRCAYVMLPLSICFIKYFPYLGRFFDPWTGAPMNTGVTLNKNELGYDCWIVGAVLFWHWLQVRQWAPGRAKRNEMILCAGLLGLDLVTLKMAHSATPLVALALGVFVIVFLGLRSVKVRRIGGYVLAGGMVCVFAGFGLGLFDMAIHLLGRNDTLTGRTDIWRMLWNWPVNPAVGAGYEGFWLGDRRAAVQNLYPGLNEAHNGYLETYLNLGYVGVALTAAILLAAYGKARRALFRDFEFGRFRLAYLLSFIIYNWTEAAFRLNAFPFFMFFLVAMDRPKVREFAAELVQEPVSEDPAMGFVVSRQ